MAFSLGQGLAETRSPSKKTFVEECALFSQRLRAHGQELVDPCENDFHPSLARQQERDLLAFRKTP